MACAVYYVYGAAQAVALASRATGTAFDPQSLDLLSIGALIGFYHACRGFPAKQTWLDAIKAGNCDTFEDLTYSNTAKYCPNSNETIMSQLTQQCQNVRLTKPKQPTPAPRFAHSGQIPSKKYSSNFKVRHDFSVKYCRNILLMYVRTFLD